MKKLVAKYKSLSVQMKVVLWFTACNFLQKGISVITTPIFTRLMSKDQYGIFSVFQAWQAILVIIVTLYLQNAVMNNAFVKLDVPRERVVSAFQSLSLVTSGSVFIVYLIFHQWINKIVGIPGVAVLAMFAYFMFWAPLQYWMLYKRYNFEYKGPVAATLLMSLLTPLAGLLAISQTELKGEARIISFVIVHSLFGLVFYIVNYRKDHTFYDKQLWKYAVAFNLPLIPCFLSETILNQSDRIMINYFCGSGDAAIYSIAYSAAQLVLLFSSALNMAFVPWQYRKLKEKDYKQMEKVGYIVLLFLAGILALVIMFAPEIVTILAGESYSAGVHLIPTLAASVFFNYMYQMFYRIELYYEHKKQSVIATFVSTIANIIGNLILIPIMGFVAAGYTTLAAHIILCVMHFYYYDKICREEMGGQRIYKARMIVLISVAMLGIALVMTFLYQSTVIRLIVLGVVFVAAAVFHKKIISRVKTMMK